jgi:D-xylose transport system ATP-binding protein
MRLGRRIATYDIHNTTPEQVVAAITGAEFGEVAENGDADDVAQPA